MKKQNIDSYPDIYECTCNVFLNNIGINYFSRSCTAFIFSHFIELFSMT